MGKVERPAEGLANFRWIIPGWLAGSAVPLSIEAVEKAGIKVVVSFIPAEEQLFKERSWRLKAKRSGIEFHTIDIENMGVPTREQFRHFLRIMDEASKRSERPMVLIHCMMGVGRTGTMAAAYLIARKGLFLEQAYRRIISGLRQVHYDMLASSPGLAGRLKAKGISLKQFVRERQVRFPESQAQENFLKAVERDFLQKTGVARRLKGPPSREKGRKPKRRK